MHCKNNKVKQYYRQLSHKNNKQTSLMTYVRQKVEPQSRSPQERKQQQSKRAIGLNRP